MKSIQVLTKPRYESTGVFLCLKLREKLMKVLNLTQVKQLVGRSKSSIYSDMKRNRFPKPIRLSKRRVAWEEQEIAPYMINKSDKQSVEKLNA